MHVVNDDEQDSSAAEADLSCELSAEMIDLSLRRTRGGFVAESSYQEERTGSMICMRVGEF